MKIKNIKLAALLAAATVLVTGALQAVPITGSIGFTGTYTQVGGTPGNLATAVTMTINTVAIQSPTGDFVGATSPTFATPIGVNGNPPAIGQLWQVTVGANIYRFVVSTETQSFTSADQINLKGDGVVTRNGTDSTYGTWQLGFGVSGASFTWQSTSAATGVSVPDGGTTVVLLGSCFSALAWMRMRNKKA